MSQPNPHWVRWIKASVYNHFLINVVTPNSLIFLVEGIHERTTTFTESPDRSELRMSGPFIRELSHRYWRIHTDINVLLLSQLGGDERNAYIIETNQGLFQEYFDTPISIRRHGDGPDDDGVELGCLTPRHQKNDSIRAIDFGQINKTDKIRQAQVDGRYEMFLKT